MLEIKHKHHLPHIDLSLGSGNMQLSPVRAEADELTNDIDADVDTHDNNWELSERPDSGELTQFWSDVEADVQSDPDWFKFENN